MIGPGRAVIGLLLLAVAAEPEAAPTEGDGGAERKIEFVNAETGRLDVFVGTWRVAQNQFDMRGKLIGTLKGTEEVRWLLDHRAIVRTVTLNTESSVIRAVGMFAWDAAEKRYRGAWFDNYSTSGPSTAVGGWDETGRKMIWTLETKNAAGVAVQYRIVDSFVDDTRRESTTFRLSGDDVVKELVTQYERTTPCPSRSIVPVFGG